MWKKRPCCVPGCADKLSVRQWFPLREKIFFLQSVDKKKVYDTYLVCDLHFNYECKNAGLKSLKIYSVPSQLLPGFPKMENRKRKTAEISCKARAVWYQEQVHTRQEASRKYGIPRNTFRNKIQCHHVKSVGRQLAFSPEEDMCFVNHILALSDFGVPVPFLICVALPSATAILTIENS
ncbi:hypothetical protein PR048_002578 [Dryococelus australis]|uniref:THAP-type domain-containing protein n=1 Tax=Dryococelus australis TaxID=614101 RepID=A0ABQ9ILA7_9NEOP|nr:hypothetical protein PR048_002578 [Dryococelus australis]